MSIIEEMGGWGRGGGCGLGRLTAPARPQRLSTMASALWTTDSGSS